MKNRAVLVVVMVLGFFIASPAAGFPQSAGDTVALHIQWIRCNDTEDYFGADEVQLELKIPGKSTVKLRKDMKPSNTWTVNKSYFYNANNGQPVIKLWDLDSPDPDDLLGQNLVFPPGQGYSKWQIITFKTNSFSYEIAYRITDKKVWQIENQQGFKYKNSPPTYYLQ
ncbi:MAG: hypothetical protein JW904_00530 [Spirochaetales bacterium]|nr:hypothetical protein [Spirochaetales bacterium]